MITLLIYTLSFIAAIIGVITGAETDNLGQMIASLGCAIWISISWYQVALRNGD